MPVTVFGNGAVQTAYVSFTALDITANSITLIWPTSYIDVPSVIDGIHYNVLAASMTVTDAGGNTNTVTLPDATESSVGSNFIITNTGAASFRLLKSDGVELINIPNTALSNSYWVQLTNNSTAAGAWQFVQFGAGTSSAVASTLAGNGLAAIGGLLNTNIPVQSINASPYNISSAFRAYLFIWKTGVGNANLPNIGLVPAGFYISFNNEGTGIATISGNANIDSSVSLAISPGQSLSIISDGTQWWTLGLGQNVAATNFIPGSAVAPSITFTGHITTGIYYYQAAFPPVNPPGLGFTVNASQICNMTGNGLFMNAGKTIILQDSTSVSQTTLSSNAAYGQLSWTGPGLVNPVTFRITSTASRASASLNDDTGTFLSFNLSTSNLTGKITYNNIDVVTIDAVGAPTFNTDVTFALTTEFTGLATFNGNVVMNGTLTLAAPLPILQGGTGQTTRQAALNALMPTTPAIGDLLFYDATNNWVRLPIGTVGQHLTVTLVAGNLIPQWGV